MLRSRFLSTLSLCTVLLSVCVTLYAQDTQVPIMTHIETDGTVGPNGIPKEPMKLESGPDQQQYPIDAKLGQIERGNLFHSFREFNIGTGDTATFLPPEESVSEKNIPITNVISRVTGGHRSDIDGTLKSEIPDADVYLINPAGIMFGPNASLNVPGSLHVSTAGELHLADGGKFNATIPSNSLLTVAPPSAFGFVDNQLTSSITINGSYLSVHEGKEMSFIGGKIEIDGSVLGAEEPEKATSGRINLAAVEAKGQVMLIKPTEAEPNLTPDLIVEPSQTQKGEIKISNSNLIMGGEQGGQIFIRAGQLFLGKTSFLYADTWGDKPSLIDIAVDENIEVTESSEISIFDKPNTTAQGSLIKISAKNIKFNGVDSYQLNSNDPKNPTLLQNITDPKVFVEKLSWLYNISPEEANSLREDKFFQDSVKKLLEDSENNGTEISFDMVVEKLGRENVAGKYHRILSTTFSKIVNRSVSQKEAAGIQITADNLTINTGSVSSYTEGDGSAGNITVTADKVTLQEFGQLEATSSGKGNAGNINLVNVNNVLLEGDSRITTEATQARGGNITLDVRDEIHLFNSQITAKASGPERNDDAGNLTISGNHKFLWLVKGSALLASAEGGRGGNINLSAKYVLGPIMVNAGTDHRNDMLRNGNSVIDATSKENIKGTVEFKGQLWEPNTPMTSLKFAENNFSLNRCAYPDRSGKRSYFIINARDILPRSPEDLR